MEKLRIFVCSVLIAVLGVWFIPPAHAGASSEIENEDDLSFKSVGLDNAKDPNYVDTVKSHWTAERMEEVVRASDADAPASLQMFSSLLDGTAQISDNPPITVGRLFYDAPVNGDRDEGGACTAALVHERPPVGFEYTRNTIITAAHCVYDRDSDAEFTNFMFVPGYIDGDGPYGDWVIEGGAIFERWANLGYYDSEVDVAIMEVNRDSEGRDITDVIGEGYVLSEGSNTSVIDNIVWGYPADGIYAGNKHPVWCRGEASGEPWPHTWVSHMYNCQLTGGASGGPWIRNFHNYGHDGSGTIWAITVKERLSGSVEGTRLPNGTLAMNEFVSEGRWRYE